MAVRSTVDIKTALAAAVQLQLVAGIPLPGEPPISPEPESVEVTPVTDLQTMIRVKFPGGGGPRYFIVRVSESL